MVKRFDATRGFGFVELDGGGDAFLHVSVLQRAGSDSVAPGARLRVRWGAGPKGPQVVEVLELDSAGEAMPRPADGGGRRYAAPGPSSASGADVRGVVKWYNAEKGFGFITPEDGGKDVFVHATALQRSGVSTLTDSQPVTMRVVQGRKGPEAEVVGID